MIETEPPVRAETLTSLLNERERTDFEIPKAWIALPVANLAVWWAVSILLILVRSQISQELTIPLGITGLTVIVLSAGTAYLVFSLVNRRNIHLAREQALLWNALTALKSETHREDARTQLPLSTAENSLYRLAQGGGERSGILWALLTFIPFLGWVALLFVLAFLTNDLRNHEVREVALVEDLDRVLKALGKEGLPAMRELRVYPNAALYFTISIITFGLFALLWLYRVIGEPRVHFAYHRSFEQPLVGQLATGTGPGGGHS